MTIDPQQADEQAAGLQGTRHPPALLHAAILLSGAGTVFLGPFLPVLALSTGTSDSGSGLFFTAQFLGAFTGGVTTSGRLARSLQRGSSAAAAGFLLLGLAIRAHAPLTWLLPVLFLLGFGVGQTLTAVNLLASQQLQGSRGSALAKINFSLSLGAVCAPFLIGQVLPFASAALLPAALGLAFAVVFAFALRQKDQPQTDAVHGGRRLPASAFLFFATLLFLYGGVETSLSGWLTTFGARYSGSALRISTLGPTALWIGITAGRAFAPLLLRRISERALLLGSLAVSVALAAALSQSSSTVLIVCLSGLLGCSLAPWFPMVLSGLLGEGASAGETGSVIAASGIGAATLPLLVGLASRMSGSLRLALFVPITGLILLLLLSGFRRASSAAPGDASGV